MNSNSPIKNLLLLNASMLFVSTSGVLGRYIQMTPGATIFWRASIAALLLLVICKIQGISLNFGNRRDTLKIVLGGILMGFHWVTYFYTLQISSVAIGMLALFTYPVLTAFLEPLLLKTSFHKRHLVLGILTLIGLYLIAPTESSSSGNWLAVILGLISALAYALRNIIMKPQINKYNGVMLMFWQMIPITIILSFTLSYTMIDGFMEQWQSITFLAICTTVIGHTLFLISFRHFSVTVASILSCSQPLFGIILGIIFLAEYPPLATWIGGSLIMTSVVIESLKSTSRQSIKE